MYQLRSRCRRLSRIACPNTRWCGTLRIAILSMRSGYLLAVHQVTAAPQSCPTSFAVPCHENTGEERHVEALETHRAAGGAVDSDSRQRVIGDCRNENGSARQAV